MQREEFIATVKAIVGDAQVLTDPKATRPYRTGFRCGGGKALAVIRPRSLVEQWRSALACVTANKIIIPQAANTGLTGGSTPFGEDWDRDVVIINTMLIAKVHVIDEGRQVICLPGTTLYQLEQALQPYGREPHSVIGSSCIGASVMGGICNNSGGALIRRGPAYTQMAIFARLDGDGHVQLVNHLDVRLGHSPEEILGRLERGQFDESDIVYDPTRCGSDRDYARRVREIDADSAARFNADPQRLFEASGSAGKLMLFAVRLDTYAKDRETRVFYIGTSDPGELTAIRRHILSRFANLPVAGEYMHRDMFDIAAVYGKDTFLTIQYLGTKRLLRLLSLKQALDALLLRLSLYRQGLSDKLFQQLSRLFPNHLPARLKAFRDRFEHYLILKMAGEGIAEASSYLRSIFPSPVGDCFECTDQEAIKAFLHRFVAAGAAVRYRAIHHQEVQDIVALDVALKRNDRDWFETLPGDIRSQIHHALYYGHFFCHVFHQDYIVRKGCDAEALEHRLWRLLDERGAEYPAEHNVGHLYPAKPALVAFYRSLDPCNAFNPGIGHTSKLSQWTRALPVPGAAVVGAGREHPRRDAVRCPPR
jgi:D-lactate dehydrogenase (quinone)